MIVIDIDIGEPLTPEQIHTRSLAEGHERAARAALADAFVYLNQLRSGPIQLSRTYEQGINHAFQALGHACEAHGLDPLVLSCKMTPIGDAS